MRKSQGIFHIVWIQLIVSFGCHSSMAPPQPVPATAPVSSPTTNTDTGQQRFEDPQGVAFEYPADWKPVPGSKSHLKVAAPNGGQMTLDVPDIPAWAAAMIPLDQVEKGYIDDVKKRLPDATITHLPDPHLANARQRRVEITGHSAGKPMVDEAVMIAHANKLFIVSIDCDEQNYPQMHAALDAVLKSLEWTK